MVAVICTNPLYSFVRNRYIRRDTDTEGSNEESELLNFIRSHTRGDLRFYINTILNSDVESFHTEDSSDSSSSSGDENRNNNNNKLCCTNKRSADR